MLLAVSNSLADSHSSRFVPDVAPAPADNPTTAEKIELGRELFFDTRLSSTKTISCNSCHNILSDGSAALSGADGLPNSIGVFGAHGGRNAPTVWNTGLRSSLFWDGRAKTLEEQAAGPIMNPVEMGMMGNSSVEKTIQDIPEYREKFRKAFGYPESKTPHQITIGEITKAIAAFERTLVTPDSPFDRFQRGEKSAMNETAQRGWQKFQEHGCIACHSAPTFDSKDFFVRFPLHEAKAYDKKYGFTKDEGRFLTTHQFKDRNVWRVPSLRNVAVTGPYFHNGAVDNLEEAVKIMAKAQLGKVLPDQDVKDIAEFLKSLTGVPVRQSKPTSALPGK